MRDEVPACPPGSLALDEQRLKTLGGPVDRGSHARRSAADHNRVALAVRGLRLEAKTVRDLSERRRHDRPAVGETDSNT